MGWNEDIIAVHVADHGHEPDWDTAADGYDRCRLCGDLNPNEIVG